MSEWKVWYQPHAKFGKRYFSGALTVSPGLAGFAGKKELGWKGMLGGNDKLLPRCRRALQPN